MPKQPTADTPENAQPRKHKAFRLPADSDRKLKEVASLFGRSETSMLEVMIDTYYDNRVEHFKADTDNRLKGVK